MKFKLDFLVIGAQKCATTWLYECLKDHPEISLPKNKREVEYIGGDLWKSKGDSWYYNLFNCDSNQIVGDVSVEYLFDDDSPKLLNERFKNLKLIASLRNPSQRAISAYYWLLRSGQIKSNESMFEYFESKIEDYNLNRDKSHVLMRGVYRDQLERYLEYYDSSQIKIIFYDSIKEGSQEVFCDICNFLGVDSTFIPPKINAKPKKNSMNRTLIKLERVFSFSKVMKKALQKMHQVISDKRAEHQNSTDVMDTLNLLDDFYKEHNIKLLSLLESNNLVDEQGIIYLKTWN